MIRSSASWHAAQSPGHVFARHAPDGCLRGGIRFGSVRIISFVLARSNWLLRVVRLATTAAYAGLPSVAWSCLLLSAVGSPELPNIADPSSGSCAVRLVAGTVRSSEFESSSGFILHAMCCDALREDWASLPAPETVARCLMSATQGVLTLLGAAAFAFFLLRRPPQLSQEGRGKLSRRNNLKKG